MRIYIESNFVLEVAARAEATCCVREDSPPCSAPQSVEPVETLARRIALWSALGRQVDVQLGELRRTVTLQAEASALVGLAIRASSAASTSLELVRTRLLRLADVLPTDAAVLRKAEKLRTTYGLEVPCASGANEGRVRLPRQLRGGPGANRAYAPSNAKEDTHRKGTG